MKEKKSSENLNCAVICKVASSFVPCQIPLLIVNIVVRVSCCFHLFLSNLHLFSEMEGVIWHWQATNFVREFVKICSFDCIMEHFSETTLITCNTHGLEVSKKSHRT